MAGIYSDCSTHEITNNHQDHTGCEDGGQTVARVTVIIINTITALQKAADEA